MVKARFLVRIVLILGLIVGLLGSSGVAQASARTANWVVSVTYQNVGSSAATVQVKFYPEGSGTPVTFDPLSGGTLAAGAGASFFIGVVSGLPTGFRGSAVMEANQPLVATVVQFSQDAGFKMRLLSNGFSSADSSTQYLIATALANKFSRTTVFSVQNAETQSVDATINFYDADAGGVLAATKTYTIPAGAAKYVELDRTDITGLPGTLFNGSAIVTAVLTGTTTPAKVIAAANELYTNRDVAANFEGLPLSRAANTLFMATALCQRFGLDTFYAVQNASLTESASITVEYFNTDGSPRTTDGPYPIGPGQKKSITTCAPSGGGSMVQFTGSAKITSTGAPIVAIGKAQTSQLAPTSGTTDFFTAFMGEPAGASKLALPFVRWANDGRFAASTGGQQRAFIAVQNLESTTSIVNVKYYDKVGNLVATHPLTIPGSSKGNSDPSTAGALGQFGMNAGEFGYYTDGTFGGAVIIQADGANPSAKFIAIARVQHPGAGEDYNAVAIP